MADIDPIDLEGAAHEKRCWVRLTYACNNRCLFCHDRVVETGKIIPGDELRQQIEAGLEQGCQRLILSGGEPTIHPEFLDMVAFGRQAGYGWIQTVTNGRLFAYPNFTAQALDAGLSEVTMSMHGHTSGLHDELVGVPGAFSQSMRGLSNLMRSKRVVLSVDVVLNARNLPILPDLMDFYLDLGIREFDLLWLVPFGRAWENRSELFVPGSYRLDSLREAIRRARDRSAVVWTNRLPPRLLEDIEELIQDPYKLNDEVRGRNADFQRYLDEGVAMPCREPERCPYCFMDAYCAQLERLQAEIETGHPRALTIDLSKQPAPSRHFNEAFRLYLWGAEPDRAAAFARRLLRGVRQIVLVLDSPPTDDPRRLDWGPDAVLSRAASGNPKSLDALLEFGDLQVEVILDAISADWTGSHASTLHQEAGRLAISLRTFDSLSSTDRFGIDPVEALGSLSNTKISLLNLPACVLPGSSMITEPVAVEHGMVDESGRIDLHRFTDHFIRNLYRVFSVRCDGCAARKGCPGMPINHIRRFGFRMLKPLDHPG